ncbi:MAG: hypothetical protein SFU56_06720 [Capsulimonadales bacterium]|nr:hypothetical protein [Capsulimonadales bacterium]
MEPENEPPRRRTLPCPPIRPALRLRWTSEPSRYPGTGSDMHWWAWRRDGSIIVVDEDGRNFDGPWCFGHVLKVTGTPPRHRVEEIAVLDNLGLKDGVVPGEHYTTEVRKRGYSRYVGGVVAWEDRLWISVYDYTWRVPGLPPDNLDVYSAHGGLVGWLESLDGGKTWGRLFRDGDPYLLGPRFTALQFLPFGPGGQGAPRGFEKHLYAVSNDSNWESGDAIYLARVQPGRLHEKTAWEFYGGKARWVSEERLAEPILKDPGHCGHSTMSYNPARKAFWLAVFSDMVPHRVRATAEEAKKTWDVATEFQLYEGPAPWGPWQLLHDEAPWGGKNHAAYLPHIPTPWIDADGLGGALLFTGDWAKHGGQWYGFMTQSFRLEPAKR